MRPTWSATGARGSASPRGTGDADGMEHAAHAGPGLLPLAIGIAGATLANALVHPYELPFAWQLASLAMFVLAVGVTAWLVVRASRPAESVPT